jgi:hypothetical protein
MTPAIRLAAGCVLAALGAWHSTVALSQVGSGHSPSSLACAARMLHAVGADDMGRMAREKVSELRQRDPARAERVSAALEAFLSSEAPFEEAAPTVAAIVDEDSCTAIVSFLNGPIGQKIRSGRGRPGDLSEDVLRATSRFEHSPAFVQLREMAPAVRAWLQEYARRLLEVMRDARGE